MAAGDGEAAEAASRRCLRAVAGGGGGGVLGRREMAGKRPRLPPKTAGQRERAGRAGRCQMLALLIVGWASLIQRSVYLFGAAKVYRRSLILSTNYKIVLEQ